jgi:hypothetical protein
MLIIEGFGTEQFLITEGFGMSVIEAGRSIGNRIVKSKLVGTPKIVGNRSSDRGRVFNMEEAA